MLTIIIGLTVILSCSAWLIWVLNADCRRVASEESTLAEVRRDVAAEERAAVILRHSHRAAAWAAAPQRRMT